MPRDTPRATQDTRRRVPVQAQPRSSPRRSVLLNDELVQVMPRVTEANDLSGAMQRGIAFETRITPVMSRTEGMVSVVMVKVTNASTGHVFM